MQVTDFTLDAFSLVGRRALVTGGNTGLGRAFTVALARAGADIFVLSLADNDRETEKLVTDCGRRYAYLHADITVRGVPAEVVDQCVADLGGIDILVNSAGICLLADVEEFDRAEWDPMVAVNLTAAFELYTGCQPGDGQTWERQDHQRRLAVLVPRRSPVTRVRRLQGGHRRLHQGLLRRAGRAERPGQRHRPRLLRDRDDHRHEVGPQLNRRIVEHIPAGRWGDPADLMGATVFLASRASDYVNGHVLVVDGGYLVR